jgi:polyribonucleotide nucleotidyltransferase
MKPFYAKVKAASHDKIYAIASKGSAKTWTSGCILQKWKKKFYFTEEELAVDGECFKYFKKNQQRSKVRNVTLDLGIRLDGRKLQKSDQSGVK